MAYVDLEDQVASDLNWRGASYSEIKDIVESYSQEQIKALRSGDEKAVAKAFGFNDYYDEPRMFLASYDFYKAMKEALGEKEIYSEPESKPVQETRGLSNVYGEPMTQEQWDSVRNMYGSSN